MIASTSVPIETTSDAMAVFAVQSATATGASATTSALSMVIAAVSVTTLTVTPLATMVIVTAFEPRADVAILMDFLDVFIIKTSFKGE